MAIADLTPEERAVLVERAQLARQQKIAAFKAKAHLLEKDFEDMPHWRRLARRFKVRMPPSYMPCSELKYARRACKRVGLNYVEWFDEKLRDFPRNNPTWPAYALVGLILEAAAEIANVEVPEEDDDFDLDALIGDPVDLGDDPEDETEEDELEALL